MLEKQLKLTQNQLAAANEIVAATAPGTYTARELYGENWEWIIRKRAHGKWFKASVMHDDLPGVRLVGKKSNKALLYEVSAGSHFHVPEHLL